MDQNHPLDVETWVTSTAALFAARRSPDRRSHQRHWRVFLGDGSMAGSPKSTASMRPFRKVWTLMQQNRAGLFTNGRTPRRV